MIININSYKYVQRRMGLDLLIGFKTIVQAAWLLCLFCGWLVGFPRPRPQEDSQEYVFLSSPRWLQLLCMRCMTGKRGCRRVASVHDKMNMESVMALMDAEFLAPPGVENQAGSGADLDEACGALSASSRGEH